MEVLMKILEVLESLKEFEGWNMICAKLEIFLGICPSELVQFWFII